ncbi:pre-mRNA 3'-end-processing factor FIP1-like isoform X3 [Lepisosteus oculatus]|uniref:pre-mRNA 3'-end-processing factor FIP1-like isoform X3 n=1 Tax=Lepisosteus oculatus TaxID=7918 RepID=UPI0037172589
MATEVGTSAPSSIAHPGVEPEEDEEHWLYGDENSEKQPGDPAPGFPDSTQESHVSSSEDKDTADQVAQSGEDEDEEDSDSDSDEDDVKVTIGNIKTGAPSYMATPMNLSLKTGRGYGAAATAKLQPKGVDLEATGNINGLPALEADPDSFEDKPWRKPGADLSDYFNYGFNEDTWKAYCEKQRRLQLGLDPAGPAATENKITVQQGRMPVLEKDVDLAAIKPEFKADFPPTPVSLPPGRVKAGPPPNRKLGGTIDVIGGQTGAIRRVEGRRREKHASDENPIQVLGDHGNKSQAFAPQAGPPPPPIGAPPPHFLHPPPPVTSVPPPLHPPGIPPPAIPGLFPPPMAPPPALLMPPLDGCPTSAYGSRPPPPFGYSSGDSSFVSYPPISTSLTPWVTSVEKGSSGAGSAGHWEYQGSRRDRERERDRTPTTSEYSNEDERYRYYSRERSCEYEREYHHGRERSREREERHRERRHRDKEDGSKHKSSRRKQHDGEEGESHRRHKHKKNKRSKEDKEAAEDGAGEGEEPDSKEQ